MRFVVSNFLLVLILVACEQPAKHFLTDRKYRDQVHQDFETRGGRINGWQAGVRSTFEDPNLSPEEREALEFLYAYMPLCDIADYDGSFFLHQVRATFRARDYFPWGKTIPETVFRHFVLPVRVNNEALDDARILFYHELKDRISSLSMHDAVLEVNHWCHEKVTYRGTDGRTSSPTALVRTSWGRCGEESTFTVAALRSVGIPARQCYTPRWAHTDDNHAWVEAWVDGVWHYIGACEPEPELDLAWFTAPAKRAMMVHTNVFGRYPGPEEKNLETALYAKINLLSNYTSTRSITVRVVDTTGQPAAKAKIKYKIYNYAQLYPVSESETDSKGEAFLTTGIGDLVVWAILDGRYGYRKVSSEEESVTLELNRRPGESYTEQMELVPPAEQDVDPVDAAKAAENALRFAAEDSIRGAYMNTFMSRPASDSLATICGLDPDRVWKYIELSQGNWKDISLFIKSNFRNPYLFEFLASLSAKDLRDTNVLYLHDHLNEEPNPDPEPIYPASREFVAKYILSPRIGLELIRPWRARYKQHPPIAKEEQTPEGILSWINQQIRISEEENYYNCPVSPAGVTDLARSDSRSRDIAFVALCRTFRIPARLEPSTSKPQYFERNRWVDALFDGPTPEESAKAQVIFRNHPDNLVKPQYEIHYTIAKYRDGDFIPLDYERDPAFKRYPVTISVDTGYYRVITGSRANDGSVTMVTEYFQLQKSDRKTIDIRLPEVGTKLQVMGIVDMNTVIVLNDGTKQSLKSLARGKGLAVCFIDPDKEPSKHILQDLPAQQQEFESWNGGLLLITPQDRVSVAFDASVFKGLPKQTVWAVDGNRSLLTTIRNTLQLSTQDRFPLTVYLSNNGGILFFSEGYRIGIGEQIIKTIRNEEL